MSDPIEDILRGLASGDAALRKVALVRVVRARPRGMLDHVIKALSDNNNEVRAAAAWALDELGDPEAVPALIAAMHDPVFDVRSNAGWALVHLAQRISPHLVVPEVIDILRDDPSFDARQMAWLVLGYIGGDDARAAIDEYWQ